MTTKLHLASQSYWTWSRLSLFLIGILLLFSFFNIARWRHRGVISSDIKSYYSFVPASLIYHDLSMNFYKTDRQYYSQYIRGVASEKGWLIQKYTIGTAIMYTPFFVLGHIGAKLLCYSQDGFTLPYRFTLMLSGLLYGFLGLLVLRKLLLRFYSEFITSVTLWSILLATNLYFYMTSEAPMSHASSFFMVTLFLYLSIRIFEKTSVINAVLLGLVGSVMVLIRPINLLAWMIPVLYGIFNGNFAKDNFKFLRTHWPKIPLIIGVALVPLFFQLWYWKSATGDWIYYGYRDQGFFFLDPKIIKGFFSYRKGWFMYSPIMFFSIIGFIFLKKKIKSLFYPLIVFSAFSIWIVFSWWAWWYGGSFGQRALIDYYGIFALPLAAFFAFLHEKVPKGKILILMMTILFVGFSVLQTLQYRKGIIHWDSMTKEAYWSIFMRMEKPDNFAKLLDHPDNENAKKGLNR